MTDVSYLADGITGSKVVVEDEVGSGGAIGSKELLSGNGLGIDAQQLIHELRLKRLAISVCAPDTKNDRHLIHCRVDTQCTANWAPSTCTVGMLLLLCRMFLVTCIESFSKKRGGM